MGLTLCSLLLNIRSLLDQVVDSETHMVPGGDSPRSDKEPGSGEMVEGVRSPIGGPRRRILLRVGRGTGDTDGGERQTTLSFGPPQPTLGRPVTISRSGRGWETPVTPVWSSVRPFRRSRETLGTGRGPRWRWVGREEPFDQRIESPHKPL